MPTTAAISAGVGALGSVGSALIGSNASQNASSQQVAAQMAALAQQKALFQQGLGVQSGYVGQASNALNPFISAGQGAAGTLSSLLTPGSSASTLSQMPGFNFQSQYGTMAATNALAAKTGPSAGPLAAAISQFNNGLAGTQYFNTVGALQNLTNTGAGAGNALASVFGNAGNAALGAGVNEGTVQGNTFGAIGNAQASGTLGSANALAGGLTGATGSASNALLLSQLFGNGNGGGGGGIYSANALSNGPSNSAISNMSDSQAAQYEQMFG
jgi:hypothetical protein